MQPDAAWTSLLHDAKCCKTFVCSLHRRCMLQSWWQSAGTASYLSTLSSRWPLNAQRLLRHSSTEPKAYGMWPIRFCLSCTTSSNGVIPISTQQKAQACPADFAFRIMTMGLLVPLGKHDPIPTYCSMHCIVHHDMQYSGRGFSLQCICGDMQHEVCKAAECLASSICMHRQNCLPSLASRNGLAP